MNASGLRRYGLGARWYDVLSFEWPVYRAGRVAAIELLGLQHGDRVLDVGCGTGLNFALLRGAVGQEGVVLGVDLSEAMLSRARLRIERRHWTNVHLEQGDAAQVTQLLTGRKECRFDAALFTYSLSIVDDWRAAWEHTLALVRPGGQIAVVDLALPTGWGRVFSPLARLACFTGGVDRRRQPWKRVGADTSDPVSRTIRKDHIHVAIGAKSADHKSTDHS